MDAKLAAKRAQLALDAENDRLHRERLAALSAVEADALRRQREEEERLRRRADTNFEEDVGLMDLDEDDAGPGSPAVPPGGCPALL
jgi:hypothetical protein